jgi:hypothetical protein
MWHAEKKMNQFKKTMRHLLAEVGETVTERAMGLTVLTLTSNTIVMVHVSVITRRQKSDFALFGPLFFIFILIYFFESSNRDVQACLLAVDCQI